MLRPTRLIATLAVGLLMPACSSDGHGVFEPLSNGLETPVTLETGYMAAGTPQRVDFVATHGEVTVTWDVTSGPCLLATASALHSGAVVEVRIHRSGNPLADCVNQPAFYHYVAHVPLLPGAYEVRLVDDMLGQQLQPVGRSMVSVTP